MIIYWTAIVLFLSKASSETQNNSLNGIHPKFENLFHKLSYHQRFSQQLKNVQFDLKNLISTSSLNSCIQRPSPKCFEALINVPKRVIPKCKY